MNNGKQITKKKLISHLKVANNTVDLLKYSVKNASTNLTVIFVLKLLMIRDLLLYTNEQLKPIQKLLVETFI